MDSTSPLNVWLLDVDRFVLIDHHLPPVTSLSIYQPSTTLYDEEGLFSETIFGPRGSSERLVNYSYIQLNTKILQPVIYKNLLKLAALYEDIIRGNSYAKFDPETRDFVKADPSEDPTAGTGYTFFMSYITNDDKGLLLKRNSSQLRSDRIAVIEKNKDNLFCDKLLVMPAGLRDLEEEQGTLTADDINKLYQTVLSYSFAIPPGSTSSIYDGVRLAIQQKALEIYDYIINILSGKRGFVQGIWGQRRVALGTRNVITAATYATLTPDHPQAIQPDESKLGVFQTMKAIQPLVVHHVRTSFFDPIFGQGTTTVALTNPKTLDLEYCELDPQELNRFDNPTAIENWISRFRNLDVRNLPVTVTTQEGKSYYLLMVYDLGDEIMLFRSLDEFKAVYNKPPLAVVVKGNPKYLDDPTVKPMADKFYDEIKKILEARGFTVKFDPGEEYTSPDDTAQVWVGHSRGIDRLRFAPPGITTIELNTRAGNSKPAPELRDAMRHNPEHYKLSDDDLKKLSTLVPQPNIIDHSKIRPITWVELFYMATYQAARDKHVFITRYPVIQNESCYPTKLHLCSTIPSRVVKLYSVISGSVAVVYPEYPILGKPFLDSVQIGTSRLAGLQADYDGDTVSANVVMSDEANAECAAYLNSAQSVVNSQRQLLIGGNDDLIAYTLLALSRA